MDDKLSPREQTQLSLWHFIPLSQYSRPREPATGAAQKRLLRLWDRLRGARKKPRVDMAQAELRAVDQSMLDGAVPSLDWKEAVFALSRVLANWLNADRSECPFRVIVGAPYSGLTEILESWADIKRWKILEEPTPEQIMAGGAPWISRSPDSSDLFLILPHLEHHYLRHYDGLEWIRKVIDRLWTFSGRCLIGCDTWAWAYLNKVLQLDSFIPEPLVLDAFDRDRLERCFEPPSLEGGGKTIIFRQADNGQFVLPPVGIDENEVTVQPKDQFRRASKGKEPDVTDFLSHVAAYSRGIQGIARAIWRDSLRSAPENADKGKAQPMADTDRRHTLWIKPWSVKDFFPLSNQSDRNLYFVLHALLLHGGLSTGLLTQILPLSSTEILQSLRVSLAAGLVVMEKDKWRVTALGYPAVRQFLFDGGYLVDAV